MVEAPPKEKVANRIAIPHVITQFARDGGIKEKKKKKSNDTARKQHAPSEVSLVSTSISTPSQATPKNKRWNFELRHRRQPSAEISVTPQSAVEAIFDTEIYELPASPNSSTKSPSGAFAVELEDNSQIALHSKRSAYPGYQSRSVIKALKQTLAELEADNQRLLSHAATVEARATAAEANVHDLIQLNLQLRQKIEYCENNHRRPSRNVASQSQRSPITPPMRTGQAKLASPTEQYPIRTSSHRSPESESPSNTSSSGLLTHHIPNKPLPPPPARPPRRPFETPSPRSPNHCQSQAQQYSSPTRSHPQVQPHPQYQSSPTKSTPQHSPSRQSRRVSLFPKINNSPTNNKPLLMEVDRARRLENQIPMGPLLSPTNVHTPKNEVQGSKNDMNGRSDFHRTMPENMGSGIDPQQYQELEVDLASSERNFIAGLFRVEEDGRKKIWI
ncbi:hypothetical protein HYALB_00005302 [Hymenoscyphus albidus]|uniref:Uncharacterized protein n=1 Tax=Hymenoscyphus albidus TaxID=595503 RepID=A0A9N9LEV4_9HELO|nr:hypothetical protein HYALB_00005302 [Hymenoscyphus albidus]